MYALDGPWTGNQDALRNGAVALPFDVERSLEIISHAANDATP